MDDGSGWVVDGCKRSRKGRKEDDDFKSKFRPLALLRADGRNRWKVSLESLWNTVECFARAFLVQNGIPRYSPPASRLASPAYRRIDPVNT